MYVRIMCETLAKTHAPRGPNGHADGDERDGDGGEQRYAERRADEDAELPEEFLIAAPWTLAPERAARRTARNAHAYCAGADT